jgi:hypothetical protein
MKELYTDTSKNASTLLKKRVENCKPHSRCHAYRHCQPCNSIRQAKLANTTVLSAHSDKCISNKNKSGVVNYLVAMPAWHGNPQSKKINKLKSEFLRIARPMSTGGLFSVETSAENQLHINAVINSRKELTASPFERAARRVGVDVSVDIQQLRTSLDVRRATAYSFKYECIPDKEDYAGNLFNLSGTTKRVGSVISSSGMFKKSPIIAIQSTISTLKGWGVVEPNIFLMQSPELKNIVRQLCSLVAQVSEFGACYIGKDLLDKEDFLDYYNSQILPLLIKPEGKNELPGIAKDSEKQKITTRQRLKNMFSCLLGFGLALPSVEIIKSEAFAKFQPNLINLVEDLVANGSCYSHSRGSMTLDDFKIIYNEKILSIGNLISAKDNENLASNPNNPPAEKNQDTEKLKNNLERLEITADILLIGSGDFNPFFGDVLRMSNEILLYQMCLDPNNNALNTREFQAYFRRLIISIKEPTKINKNPRIQAISGLLISARTPAVSKYRLIVRKFKHCYRCRDPPNNYNPNIYTEEEKNKDLE